MRNILQEFDLLAAFLFAIGLLWSGMRAHTADVQLQAKVEVPTDVDEGINK